MSFVLFVLSTLYVDYRREIIKVWSTKCYGLKIHILLYYYNCGVFEEKRTISVVNFILRVWNVTADFSQLSTQKPFQHFKERLDDNFHFFFKFRISSISTSSKEEISILTQIAKKLKAQSKRAPGSNIFFLIFIPKSVLVIDLTFEVYNLWSK